MLQHAIDDSKPNAIIHFHYCYLGPGDGEEKYVAVTKDVVTSFFLLNHTINIDTYTTDNVFFVGFLFWHRSRAGIRPLYSFL